MKIYVMQLQGALAHAHGPRNIISAVVIGGELVTD